MPACSAPTPPTPPPPSARCVCVCVCVFGGSRCCRRCPETQQRMWRRTGSASSLQRRFSINETPSSLIADSRLCCRRYYIELSTGRSQYDRFIPPPHTPANTRRLTHTHTHSLRLTDTGTGTGTRTHTHAHAHTRTHDRHRHTCTPAVDHHHWPFIFAHRFFVATVRRRTLSSDAEPAC